MVGNALRRAGVATVVATLGFCTLTAVARADSFTWSTPTPVGPANTRLGGFACPSASLCAAVTTGGMNDTSSEIAFPPSAPSGQTTTALVNGYTLAQTACASQAVCDSVVNSSGLVASFTTSNPGPVQPVLADPSAFFPTGNGGELEDSGVISALACASPLLCVATDESGAVVTFSPDSPGSATSPVLIDTNVEQSGGVKGVACASPDQCTLADDKGGEVTFAPGPPGVSNATFADIGGGASAIACPSMMQCTAVGAGGGETTFNPQTGTVVNHVIVDPFTAGQNTDLAAVACPLATQCTAVDGSGHEVTFDPTAAAPATRNVIAQGVALAGIQCPSPELCVVSDTSAQSGDVWVGTAPAPSSGGSPGSTGSTGPAVTTSPTGSTSTTSTTSTTGTTSAPGTTGSGGSTGSGGTAGHAIKVRVIAASSVRQTDTTTISVTNPNGYTMITGCSLYTGMGVFFTGGAAADARAPAKHNPVLIAAAQATIAPHHTAKLKLKLSRKARAYLKRHHTLAATLVLTLKATGQLTTTVRRPLTLRLSKPLS